MREPTYPDTVFIPPKPEETNPLKLCTKCSRLLPLHLFDALLTRAQMKARGYAGVHRIPYSAARCQNCRPKKPPLIKQTPNQIKHHAVAGDITHNLAQTLIETKRTLRKDNQKRSALRRWTREHFQPLLDTQMAENMWVLATLKRLETFKPKKDVDLSIARAKAMVAFLQRYHALLSDIGVNIRAHRAQSLKGNQYDRERPPYEHIADYTTEAAIAELRHLWTCIPDNTYRHEVVLLQLRDTPAKPAKK